MDKETLGQYGWLVVCVIILAIMITLATPFGSVIRGEVEGIVTNFKDTATTALDGIVVESNFGGGGSGDTGGGSNPTPLAAGLYQAGTTTQLKSWDDLLVDGTMGITSGTVTTGNISAINGDLILPEGVTAIGGQAFVNCNGLTGITIPASVTSIGYEAFKGCVNLADVKFANGLETIAPYAFDGCTSLSNVEIPNSVTTIGNNAFCNSGLASVPGLGGVEAIEDSVFANCANFTSAIIPNNINAINGQAFANCSNLTTVTIPGSVESIFGLAFSGSPVTDFYFDGTTAEWNALFGMPLQNTGCTVHCTDNDITY